MEIKERLDPIFKPSTLALIGASDVEGKWGNWVMHNLLNSGYRGTIYPINPNEEAVVGHQAYRSVLDVPEDIDLAVFTIPSKIVLPVMEQCVQKGVKGAIVVTAGFAEIGGEGRALQEELVKIARNGNINFVGPNCMGVWSSAVRLNTTFKDVPLSGGISFVSQSGTMGDYLFHIARSKGYGFSKFVSSGNQACLNVADYMEYLAQDDDTQAMVFYIEGMPEGRRLFELAREATKVKPVIVYKAGKTAVGSRAAQSHTGSLSGVDEIFDAAARQAGIIRCHEVLHPFDAAEALINQPLPSGKRVAIVGDGGGYCVTSSDTCATMGLEVPEIDSAARAKIRELLLPHAPEPRNPVDTAADPRPVPMARIADIVAGLDYIDGLIILPPVPFFDRSLETQRQLLEAYEILGAIPEKYGKPLIATSIYSEFGGGLQVLKDLGKIPFYLTPEDCARAMVCMAQYAQVSRRR
jgi:acetyltransferase